MKTEKFISQTYTNEEHYLYTQKSPSERYLIIFNSKCISSLKGLKNHLKWVEFYVEKYGLEITDF